MFLNIYLRGFEWYDIEFLTLALSMYIEYGHLVYNFHRLDVLLEVICVGGRKQEK